jgi:uncharacterized membrane protein HdeD (DUF308 family)
MRLEDDVTVEAGDYWWVLLVFGIASILFGIALIAWPGKTLTVLAVLLGVWLLVVGVVRFLQAIFDRDAEHRVLLAVVGILGVVLGLLVMRDPLRTIWVIAVIVGLFWLISGFVDVFRVATKRITEDRGLNLTLGVVAIVAGAVVLLWPDITILVLAIVGGIYLIVSGIVQSILAFRLRAA